jgi:hypothetical protein
MTQKKPPKETHNVPIATTPGGDSPDNDEFYQTVAKFVSLFRGQEDSKEAINLLNSAIKHKIDYNSVINSGQKTIPLSVFEELSVEYGEALGDHRLRELINDLINIDQVELVLKKNRKT